MYRYGPTDQSYIYYVGMKFVGGLLVSLLFAMGLSACTSSDNEVSGERTPSREAVEDITEAKPEAAADDVSEAESGAATDDVPEAESEPDQEPDQEPEVQPWACPPVAPASALPAVLRQSSSSSSVSPSRVSRRSGSAAQK